MNRGWIDPDADAEAKDSKSRPSAATSKKSTSSTQDPNLPWGTLADSEDEFDEKAEEFENTYNFRFEEPGSSNIITHARNVTATARRADDTRKTARQLKAEKKAQQVAEREEITKREKGKKRREIERRLDTLRKELGEAAFKEIEGEMDGEWDEEGFDRVMDKVLQRENDDVSLGLCYIKSLFGGL